MEGPALPTIFVSHGAPTLPLEDIPTRRFLSGLGERFRGARAVLCISAHWATARPAVNAVEAPEPDAAGRLMHRGWQWGNLGMAAYEFGG